MELTKYLHQTLLRFVAIQETKLRESDEFTMPGYHALRSDRKQGRRDDTQISGGVITLLREGIAFRCLERPCVAPND